MKALWIALGTLGVLGCDAPAADLREWTPKDHQHTNQSGAQAKGQVDGQQREVFPGVDQVTLGTWKAKCVLCHGQVGRGDGPQAAMFKPKDLTDPTWHASITDAQIIESIQKGKGKMPGFALPESTAEGLMKLVRVFNRDRNETRATSAAPTTGPAVTATAPTAAAPTPSATSRKGAASHQGPRP